MAESPEKPSEDAALQARLDSLSASLEARKSPQEKKLPAEDLALGGAMNLGFRVLTEFVAGIGVGALVGWQLDKWLHTSPALLIVFLTLGTAAGFWNVYRLAARPTSRRDGPL